MPFFQLSDQDYSFPPPYFADTEGMIAVGGDLSPERVLEAYHNGIYFWFGPMDPIKWWSPDPRVVLYPADFNTNFSMKDFNIEKIAGTSDFENLLRQIQLQENQGKMGPHWITEEMINTYQSLFSKGFISAWQFFQDEKIVGGTFGIQLGQIIFLEYLLNHPSENSSKPNGRNMIALLYRMKEENILLVDIQKETIRINDIGICEVSRLDYLEQIKQAIAGKMIKNANNHI